jgi:hypothetical protein
MSTKSRWTALKEQFIREFAVEADEEQDRVDILILVANLNQGEQNIGDYIYRAENLSRRTGMDPGLDQLLAQRFVQGLKDRETKRLVSVILSQKTGKVTFKEAKDAVVSAYTTFGQTSIIERSQGGTPTVSTAVSQSELGTQILQGIREILTEQRQHQQASGNQEQAWGGGRATGKPNYRPWITCYNCAKPGHVSDQCPEPPVSTQQYNANREAIRLAQERQRGNGELRPQFETPDR